jgi:hypothetical protein
MTPSEAKELLPIITAYAEGKEIEIKAGITDAWSPASNLHFNGEPSDYRIKPTPREWWLLFYADDTRIVCDTDPTDISQNATEIIHVREVL